MSHLLELDGKNYPFKIGISALVRAEQITGKSLLTGFEPSLEVFVAMGYGGIFAYDNSFSMPYEDYLDKLVPEHLEVIINAYKEAMPDQSSGSPTKKKRTTAQRKSSPGKKSTASA
ncbi:MAG: hypothetical protein AAF944_04630 [Bacteroidota bacterium]